MKHWKKVNSEIWFICGDPFWTTTFLLPSSVWLTMQFLGFRLLNRSPVQIWFFSEKKEEKEKGQSRHALNQIDIGYVWHVLTYVFSKQKLKYGSQEKISFCCRCSSFLSLTFVEIKKSFTEMLLSINYRNFEIFFSWKKTDIS